MSYDPLYFKELNKLNSMVRPGTVHTNDLTTRMFERYLYFRFFSLFPMKIPEHWDETFIQRNIYRHGFQMIAYTEKYGIVPVNAKLYGFDIFYRPNRFNVHTPLISLSDKKIGIDGELIRLTPDYMGLYDFIHFIAEKQSLCSQALDMNLINSKLAYILTANNKAGAETLKALFDQIQEGQPAIVTQKSTVKGTDGTDNIFAWSSNLSSNFIAPELMELFRELDRIFDDYMGIPDVGTEKKERLTNGEVNASAGKRVSMAETYYKMLKDSIKKVIKLYPELEGKLSVSYIYEDMGKSEDLGTAEGVEE